MLFIYYRYKSDIHIYVHPNIITNYSQQDAILLEFACYRGGDELGSISSTVAANGSIG
jgi:transcription initiation factor IIE alpha subunit